MAAFVLQNTAEWVLLNFLPHLLNKNTKPKQNFLRNLTKYKYLFILNLGLCNFKNILKNCRPGKEVMDRGNTQVLIYFVGFLSLKELMQPQSNSIWKIIIKIFQRSRFNENWRYQHTNNLYCVILKWKKTISHSI